MVDGDSCHLWLDVLFLYITNGIYRSAFLEIFICFLYFRPSFFSEPSLLLIVAKQTTANWGLSVFWSYHKTSWSNSALKAINFRVHRDGPTLDPIPFIRPVAWCRKNGSERWCLNIDLWAWDPRNQGRTPLLTILCKLVLTITDNINGKVQKLLITCVLGWSHRLSSW